MTSRSTRFPTRANHCRAVVTDSKNPLVGAVSPQSAEAVADPAGSGGRATTVRYPAAANEPDGNAQRYPADPHRTTQHGAWSAFAKRTAVLVSDVPSSPATRSTVGSAATERFVVEWPSSPGPGLSWRETDEMRWRLLHTKRTF